MKTCCERVLMMGSVVLFLGLWADVWASEAGAVYDRQGTPSCTAIASGVHKEIKDVKLPPPGQSKSVEGPGGLKITYTLGSNGTSLSEWHISSQPVAELVNLTILTRRGAGSRVFYFPIEGVASDTDEQAGGTLSQVAFCLGLAGPPEPLEPCDSGLCPSTKTETRVLITLDPDASQWGVEACTCGETFEACTAGAPSGAPDACPKPGGQLLETPVHIEAVRDESFVCFTIGGKRRCFKR